LSLGILRWVVVKRRAAWRSIRIVARWWRALSLLAVIVILRGRVVRIVRIRGRGPALVVMLRRAVAWSSRI
jgi:hypothetical protein